MVATLKDVALRAGVSIKTVSNVINGNVPVTEEKRERVRAAIAELHYQPNLSARFLRKSHVGIIALAIPDLGNPYFADIGNAVVSAAANHSYTVLLDHTGGDREQENRVINGLRPHLIDGVILSALALEANDLKVQQGHLPIVLLGERYFDVPYDHIAMDSTAAARLAVEHLLSIGKKRIAAIGAQDFSTGETARQRLLGYTEAIAQSGTHFDSQYVAWTPSFNVIEGIHAMRSLLTLTERPDAVLCFNDKLALGAMRVLHEEGIRIPEDIAVIGIDDIEEGRYSYPSLTTIAPDKHFIGETAVSYLLQRIKGTRTQAPEHVNVPFKLITRESTLGRAAH